VVISAELALMSLQPLKAPHTMSDTGIIVFMLLPR